MVKAYSGEYKKKVEPEKEVKPEVVKKQDHAQGQKDLQSLDTTEGAVSKNWVFYQEPTREDFLKKFEKLDKIYTVHVKDFVDYAIALSQSVLIKETGEKVVVWLPYMQVAGRLNMFNKDMENRKVNGFIYPDPNVPEGNPKGWVYQDDTRLVYRVVIEIQNEKGLSIGKRAGTAWVPWTGGGFVIQNNRFEKVETSATGRALAGFGYGVLPGSGVASYEEMQSVASLIEPEDRRTSKTALINELTDAITKYIQVSGAEREIVMNGMDQMTQTKFKKSIKGPRGFGQFMISELNYIIQTVYKRIDDYDKPA